jgi:hypothetical protein
MKSTDLKDMFKEFKVLTLKQAALKHKCSIRTVQRKFTHLPVLRSYNKNSRYYTLSDIPDFNNNGIWRYRDIFFSANGNLKKTVKNLILASERGLNGNEIGEIVNLSPRSFMHRFHELEGVFREKHEGVYVYFSDDPATYSKQCSKRVYAGVMRKIDDAVAVKILVEHIRHPEMSTEELSIVLRDRRCCDVSASEIQNLLAFHDLLKKTRDSKR